MDKRQQLLLAAGGAILLGLLVVRDVVTVDSLLFFAVLIPSVIVHEVSHGALAYIFGDDTAKRAGRLTLNPVAHVDPLGTLIIPGVLVLTTGTAFGYAKPVPVVPRRMRSPRNHNLVVALGGPAVNIVLALLAAAALITLAPVGLDLVATALEHGHLFDDLGDVGFGWTERVVFELGIVNVILATFNLIPLPPLDGSAVVERVLPRQWWPAYLRIRQYSMIVLLVLVLLLPGALTQLFRPTLRLWAGLL